MERHKCLWIQIPKKVKIEWCDKCAEIKKEDWHGKCDNYPLCLEEIEIVEGSEFKCLQCGKIKDKLGHTFGTMVIPGT